MPARIIAKLSLQLEEKENLRNTLVLLAISLSLGFFTGCNTMEGFGEDIERSGEEIEEAAE